VTPLTNLPLMRASPSIPIGNAIYLAPKVEKELSGVRQRAKNPIGFGGGCSFLYLVIDG
jgi:hypothetical protein